MRKKICGGLWTDSEKKTKKGDKVCVGGVFTNPSLLVGCDIRSIFKQSLAGLNSGFSFS